ncbi:MAG: HTTM domain-containing protein [Saprospiraceae bacterium]|nr:HTTM domain-containing protein [Saprospiraceae bacterium]
MHNVLYRLDHFLFKSVSIAPLVVFRLVFGSLLLYSTIRTWQKGWIKELYLDPSYHFSFFSWLKPLSSTGMYWVYAFLIISALGILLGLFYRFSTLLFLLLFTYVELLDKTYYLNHYYLVTILTFWLLFVPANRFYALDALLFPKIKSSTCANWHIAIFKVQLSIVYFFAGLAKVNPDWLFRAQPMATWLPGKYELPILGQWMHYKETAFLFSWAGCIYDLSIWLFLWIKKTRVLAYFAVLAFHILTAILFPRIGMFPLIMITSTIIFFSPRWHEKLLSFLPFSTSLERKENARSTVTRSQWLTAALVCYFLLQLYLPFRYLQYSGNLFWHERGYRFSWRVMLMEKNGYTSIIIRNPKSEAQREVNQDDYLTAFQKQQMRSQPDLILQFAKYIGDEFEQKHGYAPEVYVKSRLSLNGRRSQPFTDETIDVYALDDPMNSNWILPLKE